MPRPVPIDNKNPSPPPVSSALASSTSTATKTTAVPIVNVSQSQTNLVPETALKTLPSTTTCIQSPFLIPLMPIGAASVRIRTVAKTPVDRTPADRTPADGVAAIKVRKHPVSSTNTKLSTPRKIPLHPPANLLRQPLSTLAYLLKFKQSFLETSIMRVLDGDRTSLSEEQISAIEEAIGILVKKVMDAEPIAGNVALEKISGYVDSVKRKRDTSDIDSGVISIITANLDREEQEIEQLRSNYALYSHPQHVSHDYPIPSINACAENCLRLLNPRYWFERGLYRNTDQIDLLEALEMGQLRVARFDLMASSGIEIEGDPTPEDLLAIQHVFAPAYQDGVVHDITWYCGGTESGMRAFFARLDPQRTYLLRTSLAIGDEDYGRNGHWQILRNSNGRWIGRETADGPVIFTRADGSLTRVSQALIGVPTEWGPTGCSLDAAQMTKERQDFLAEYTSQYRYLTSTREKNRNEPTKAATRWAQLDAAKRATASRYLIKLESDPISYTHSQILLDNKHEQQFLPVREFATYQDDWDYLTSPVADTSADESLMVLNHMYGFNPINQAQHYANIYQWVQHSASGKPQQSFRFAKALTIAAKKGFILPLNQLRETHYFRDGAIGERIQLWLDGLDRALPYLITQPPAQGFPPQNMLLFFRQNRWWVFNNSYQDVDGNFRPETFDITSLGQLLPDGRYLCGQLNEDGINVLSADEVWDDPAKGTEGYRIEYIPIDASRLHFMLEFIQQVRLVGYDLAISDLTDPNSIQWSDFMQRFEVAQSPAMGRIG